MGLRHGRYLLAVGTLEPRKNLSGCIAAYASLPEALRRRYPLVVVMRLGDFGNNGYDDGLAGDRAVQRVGERPEPLWGRGVVGAGKGRGDAVTSSKEQVDQVARHCQPGVAERTEQVFAPMCNLQDTGEAEHARGPFDGVRIPEHARHDLSRHRMGLELQQAR